MTDVYIAKTMNSVSLSIRNHCKNRDVCLSISALANALCQYTDVFRDEQGGLRVDRLHYERGNVELFVRGAPKIISKYVKTARAIWIGFELYAENYPDDVRVTFR